MNYRMLITYIIVDIFCIIIVGVIQKNLTTDSGSELEVKTFKQSLWSYILFMVTGLLGLITENADLFYSRVVDYIANILSLSCLALSSLFWFIYVQLRVNKKFIVTKWRILAYIPMGLVLVLCISSPLTGWAFYIDDTDSYVRGPMFMFVSGIPLLYDIASSCTAYYRGIKEKQLLKKKQYFNLAAFIYFPLVASILQIWLAGMPILAPAIATSYYIIFISAQRDMIYNDSLTGLNNRRHAMIYMEDKIANVSESNPLTVFMIDGNKFKLINDTYGHIEGDSAIVCMAEAIQSICYKYKFFGARYGGDEFVMVKAGGGILDKDAIGDEINEVLGQICHKKEKVYRLSVTVGSYTSVNHKETVDMIIKRADENLYQKKKNRRN